MSMDLIAALGEKMVHLDKMRQHLNYSYQQVKTWWSVAANFDGWNEEQLESLAAFKARFSELQDHIGSAMRLIAQIEEEDTRQFTYVLNYMSKLYIIDGVEQWLELRALRNAATHDYSASEATKAMHFHQLLQNTEYLFNVLNALSEFIKTAYPSLKEK